VAAVTCSAGERMGNRLGQTIYVENRTGAAGTIGAQLAATSPPDGYTITIGGMTTHVLAPAVYPNLPYDPIRDSLRQLDGSERHPFSSSQRRTLPPAICKD
jgi:tripartite-type tricarboxylate transporter receptor subunit TctC